MEPWEQYPHIWKTKSAFFTWIQHTIHKEVFSGIEDTAVVLLDVTCFEDVTDFIRKAIFVKPKKEMRHTSKLPGVVYWLHTDSQIDYLTEGYVGVTYNLDVRLDQHRRQCLTKKQHHKKHNGMVQAFEEDTVVADILFCGEYNECLSLEKELRPQPRVGWNLAVGGDGGNIVHGLTNTKVAKTFYNLRTKAKKCGVSFFWEGKLEEFALFYKETKPTEKGYVLTRLDCTKDWCPDNVVWTTHRQSIRLSAKESSVYRVGEICGTIGELAGHFGLKPNTVSCRLRDGWALDEALGITTRHRNG